MSYLFKQNLTLKAKQQYTGNWIIASQIFILYDYLADPRNETFSNEMGLETINRELIDLWITIYREHLKHLNLDRKLIDKITHNLKVISPYYKSYFKKEVHLLVKISKLGKYKEMLQDLISYMVSFFKELGINVKSIKIPSDITGIPVYAFTTNLNPSEEYIEEQININTSTQNKILDKVKEKYLNQGMTLVDQKGFFTIYKDNTPFGYILPGEWDTVYNDLPTILQKVKKNTLIENNYSKLIYKNGQLLTPQGNPIKQLDFVPPNKLQKKLEDYQETIDTYNATLKPYEPKLANTPKTITLGDHTLMVQKVVDKNILRLVVIEGKYTGLYLDQMIASNGQVIESVKGEGYTFSQTKDLYENTIGNKKPITITDRVKDYTPKNSLKNVEFRLLDDYGDPLEDDDGDYVYKTISKVRGIKKALKDNLLEISGLNLVGDIYPKIHSDDLHIFVSDTTVEVSAEVSEELELNMYVRLDEKGNPESLETQYLVLNECMPEGLGTKLLVQQVKSAIKSKFKNLILEAEGDFENTSMVGYYVWPKLGYDTDFNFPFFKKSLEINDPIMKEKIIKLEQWLKQHKLLNRKGDCRILDIYACKVDGKFIGQEIWRRYGEIIDLTFDLTPGSLSLRIFDRYVQLKAKKEGIPVEDFLNVNYTRYSNEANRGLQCALKSFNYTDIVRAINIAIANHENGEILYLLEKPDTIKYLIKSKIIDDNIVRQLRTLSKTYRTDSKYKFASSKPTKQNPLFRELDMGILDQVWNEVNKEYESL